MTSSTHFLHIQARTSHANCGECNADGGRQRAAWQNAPWPGYRMVREYLQWILPRLAEIRQRTAMGTTADANRWQRDFLKALHTRITLKGPAICGRKHDAGYLERLKGCVFPGAKFTGQDLRLLAGRW